MKGEKYKIIGISKSHGQEKLKCQGSGNNTFFVAIEYTNKDKKVQVNNTEKKSTIEFSYNDLVALMEITSDIMCKGDYVAMSEKYVAGNAKSKKTK